MTRTVLGGDPDPIEVAVRVRTCLGLLLSERAARDVARTCASAPGTAVITVTGRDVVTGLVHEASTTVEAIRSPG